jgi:leader peptidase (prepilin peptidase)/N-methyltransferase
MDVFFYLLIFVFGSSLGSFYLTTAERVLLYFYGKKRKIGDWKKRIYLLFTVPSHCEACDQKIRPDHLIPVIGYFLSQKKCHSCGIKLKMVYPLSEVLFGLCASLTFYATDSLLFSISFTFLLGHLLIAIFTDASYFSLDYENLPFIILFGSLANYALLNELPGITELYVFLGFVLFYVAIYFIVKQGMGLGDVFFAPVFAFLAGHPFWILFLNSSYTLAIIITYLSRKKGEKLKGKMIPMGVYFSLGLFFTYIAKVLYYYLGMEGFLENSYES